MVNCDKSVSSKNSLWFFSTGQEVIKLKIFAEIFLTLKPLGWTALEAIMHLHQTTTSNKDPTKCEGETNKYKKKPRLITNTNQVWGEERRQRRTEPNEPLMSQFKTPGEATDKQEGRRRAD